METASEIRQVGFTAALVALSFLLTSEPVGAQGPPKRGVPVVVTNDITNPLPVDVLLNRPPIPFDISSFQRQYCEKWETPVVIQVDGTRQLVQYEAKLPLVEFPEESEFSGRVYGYLWGRTDVINIGHSGRVDVISTCEGSPPRGVNSYLPTLQIPTNQYEIETEVSGTACTLDLISPIELVVVANIVEYSADTAPTGLLITGDPGSGTVCFTLETTYPRSP